MFCFQQEEKEKTETETERKSNLAPKGRVKVKRIPQSEKKLEKEQENRRPNETDKATLNHIKRKIEKEKEPTKKKNIIDGLSFFLLKGKRVCFQAT